MKNISNNRATDKLIFALDVQSCKEALSWIDLLSGHVGMFKVGKELFTAFGPKIVDSIKEKNQKIFLDLKFHDIPNTVARAAQAAVKLGVDMFNIHATGGSKMISETVSAVDVCAANLKIKKPVILAVTVLTSLDDHDLNEIGFKKNADELVIDLARMAVCAGASGVVASPCDIYALRNNLGNDFVIVTPGIRAGEKKEKADDQKRTLSAYEAIKAGADYIVVGRPISAAEKPLEACGQIIQEIAEGLAARI
ncbi:MAG TPA: orotidine-5'-phosphate decarboxylase [Deltaproteobacteria bacterium]|nr:orotidine-5'-phosphate decarboxylase [Deltaproteobacteria bacterium]